MMIRVGPTGWRPKLRSLPAMLDAGLEACRKWDANEEEPECLVAAVYHAMRLVALRARGLAQLGDD
jgi:hypothetical protein